MKAGSPGVHSFLSSPPTKIPAPLAMPAPAPSRAPSRLAPIRIAWLPENPLPHAPRPDTPFAAHPFFLFIKLPASQFKLYLTRRLSLFILCLGHQFGVLPMPTIPAHPFAASDSAALVQALDLLHTHIPAFDRPTGPQLTPSQALARQFVPQALAKLQSIANSSLPSIALRACQTILRFAAPGRIPRPRRHPPGKPVGRTTSCLRPSPARAAIPPTPPVPPAHSSRSEMPPPPSQIPTPASPPTRFIATLLLIFNLLRRVLGWILPPSPTTGATIPTHSPPRASLRMSVYNTTACPTGQRSPPRHEPRR